MVDFSRTEQTNERVENIYTTRSFVISEINDEVKVQGLTFQQPILPGTNIAQCPSGKHQVPDAGCSCGFYCYDDPDGRLWLGKGEEHGQTVDAIVKISGRVVVHGSGIRAQCLEIVAFITNKERRAHLARKWNPSVPVFEYIEDAIKEFPITSIEREKSTRSFDWAEAKNAGARGGLLMLGIVATAGLAALQVLVLNLKQPILMSVIGLMGIPLFLWIGSFNEVTTRILSRISVLWMDISVLVGLVVASISFFSGNVFDSACSIAAILPFIMFGVANLEFMFLIPLQFFALIYGYNPPVRIGHTPTSFEPKLRETG